MELKGSVLQWPADRPRLSRLIFFLLGALMTTTFAPFGLALLMPLILLPLFYVVLTVSPRDAAAHCFWFGMGLFLTGTYWIVISVTLVGGAPVYISLILMIGLVLVMSVWLAITGWLTNLLSHGEPLRLLFVAPAVWVIIEWLRGWVFTGFPWMSLGYGHVGLPIGGFAPVLGVYGVSFMLVFSSAAILVALMSERLLRGVAVAAVILPWIVGGILDAVDWTEPDGAPVKTTILQAGIPQEQKWNPEQLLPTMAYYRNATLRAADSELVVWPEIAIPIRAWQRDSLNNFLNIMRNDTLKRGQSVAFGVFEFKQDRGELEVYNSIALLERDRALSYYHKRHLVPFGEYFPVPDFIIDLMIGLEKNLGDISAGAPDQALLETGSGLRFASVICYEDAYGAEQLYAFPEAALIVNVSNDGWFGNSIAPHQHLQIARMRSLETGRQTVRSTNNGISAFIDEKGRIVQRGPQFQQSRMTRSVQPMRGATPYVESGNWPILVLSFALLGFFWIRSRGSL